MQVSTHLIASSVIALVLYPIYGELAFLALIGGWMIDIDHYLAFFLLKGRVHPIKTYRYFKDRPKDGKSNLLYEPYIFHSTEFLLLILVFWQPWFVPFTAGLVAHLIMDLIHEFQTKRFPAKKTSLIFLYLWKASRGIPLLFRESSPDDI